MNKRLRVVVFRFLALLAVLRFGLVRAGMYQRPFCVHRLRIFEQLF